MKIQLYGQPTWNYEYLRINLLNKAKKSGVSLKIEEINKWSTILEDAVETIPTVKIDDNNFVSKSSGESINHFAKKVFTAILEKENYGEMPVLVVPVDFSEASKNAFIYAVQLAEKINASIKVVHVYHPKARDQDEMILNGKSVEMEKRKRLQEFLEHNSSHWLNESIDSPLIMNEFLYGMPTKSILDFSKKFQNSIIVMGTTGQGNKMKKRYGSISTDVAQLAECPVLLIPPSTKGFKVDHICYALDKVTVDTKAAVYLAPLAKQFDAFVSLTHVSDQKNDKWHDLVQYWKLIYPKHKIALHRYSDVDISLGLQDFCASNEVDLLVMSARNHSFFDSFFHKSNTQTSAVYTQLPLLILHEKK